MQRERDTDRQNGETETERKKKKGGGGRERERTERERQTARPITNTHAGMEADIEKQGREIERNGERKKKEKIFMSVWRNSNV